MRTVPPPATSTAEARGAPGVPSSPKSSSDDDDGQMQWSGNDEEQHHPPPPHSVNLHLSELLSDSDLEEDRGADPATTSDPLPPGSSTNNAQTHPYDMGSDSDDTASLAAGQLVDDTIQSNYLMNMLFRGPGDSEPEEEEDIVAEFPTPDDSEDEDDVVVLDGSSDLDVPPPVLGGSGPDAPMMPPPAVQADTDERVVDQHLVQRVLHLSEAAGGEEKDDASNVPTNPHQQPGNLPYEEEPGVNYDVWNKYQARKKKGFIGSKLRPEQFHLLGLLELLNGLPLTLFDDIIKWASHAASEKIFSIELKLPNRVSFLSDMRKRCGIDDYKPINDKVHLPHANVDVMVTTFDIEETILSWFLDREMMADDNLLFHDKDDPLAGPEPGIFPEDRSPPPDDYMYKDINTGRIAVENYHFYVPDPTERKKLVVGNLLFIDKTHIDVQSRCCLEPVMMVPTLFNKKARSSPRAFRVLGYIPNDEMHKSSKDAGKKNHDYHVVIKHILQGYHNLQKKGPMYWELPYKGKIYPVQIQFYFHALLGDGEGHNKATGHFQNNTLNVKYMCRLCNTPSDKLDDPDFPFKLLGIKMIRSPAGAKKYCYRFLGNDKENHYHNAFDVLDNGKYFGKFGINLLAQTDSLHDRLKGDMETAHNCFIDQKLLDKDMQGLTTEERNDPTKNKLFSDAPKHIAERAGHVWGALLGHNSNRNLPKTHFAQGHMSTTKINAQEYSGLILLHLLLLTSTLGQFWFDSVDPKEDRRANKEDRGFTCKGKIGSLRCAEWVQLFDLLLLIDAFERTDSCTEKERRMYENFLNSYLKFYKVTVDKQTGNMMMKPKYHSKNHRGWQMLENGTLASVDTIDGECGHIPVSKISGRRTQLRSATVDYQTGCRVAENLTFGINVAAMNMDTGKGSESPSAKKGSVLMGSACVVRSIDRDGENGPPSAAFFIVNPEKKSETPTVPADWYDRNLQKDLEHFFASHIFPYCSEDTLSLRNSYHVYGKEPAIYRAEPGKKSQNGRDPGWNDWAFVEMVRDDGKRITNARAHLLCYVNLVGLDEPLKINGQTVNQDGEYVICHADTGLSSELEDRDNDFAFAHANSVILRRMTKDYSYPRGGGKATKHHKKRAKKNLLLYLLPVTAIQAPCIGVPDIWPQQHKGDFHNSEDIQVNRVEFFEVANPLEWCDMFTTYLEEHGFDKGSPEISIDRPTEEAQPPKKRKRPKKTKSNKGGGERGRKKNKPTTRREEEEEDGSALDSSTDQQQQQQHEEFGEI